MSTPRSHQASRDSANAENLLGESPTPRRSVLLATPRAASLQKGSLQQLTPTERRYVLMSRCGAVLLRCGFALGSTATLSRKLELVGGNIRAYAAATANVQSAISASQLLLAPTVGALSDSLGRRPLQLASSIAMMFWHLFLANRRLCNSIFRYQAFGVLCMGVCSAGSMTVRQAALADLFGSRPSIAAQIESQNMFWVSTVGMFAPLVGAEIARRAPNLALQLAAAVCVLQLPLIFFMPETLTKQERKPLRGSLKFSNPLSNVAVLFSNGPGLRGLAIVNVLYAGCNGAYFPTELAVAQCTQYLGHPHYHHRLLCCRCCATQVHLPTSPSTQWARVGGSPRISRTSIQDKGFSRLLHSDRSSLVCCAVSVPKVHFSWARWRVHQRFCCSPKHGVGVQSSGAQP